MVGDRDLAAIECFGLGAKDAVIHATTSIPNCSQMSSPAIAVAIIIAVSATAVMARHQQLINPGRTEEIRPGSPVK